MSKLVSLANPIMTRVGPSSQRKPQPARHQNWPVDTTIVAADTHWEICEDIFYENFPDRLKEKAPRVWFDKFWHIGFPGEMEALNQAEGLDKARIDELATGCLPAGCSNMETRRKELAVEGIEMEIVYPQSLLGFLVYKDLEVQELMYRTYNEYIARLSADSAGRFHGVGVFSNWWDPEKVGPAMQQIVDLKLKTFMIPGNPGRSLDGRQLAYGDVLMERFWDVVAEAGLPVSFHVGENFDVSRRGGLGVTVANAFNTFRKPFSELVFGGVFDAHPNLKIVFAEGGLSWVLSALQDCEMVYDTYGSGALLDPIKERPTFYWQNNCYATFQNDLLGLRNLQHIGADNVMWANDYPHPEGSFGFTSDSIQSVIDATTPDEARNILGGTAIKLYKLYE